MVSAAHEQLLANVRRIDGEAIWVSAYRGNDVADNLRYRGSKKHLSFALAQSLPAQFGLEPAQTPVLETPDGWWWFHWLGDLYGHALLHLLHYHVAVKRTKSPGLYLHLTDHPQTIVSPTWTIAQIRCFVEDHYRNLEHLLDLGAFHHLLTSSLQRQAVVEQFDVPKFADTVNRLQLWPAPDNLREYF